MKKLGEIKLSMSPEEIRTTIILGVVYQLRQLWNTIGFWTIDILSESGADLITGVKLVSKINLLRQYPGIPFDIFILGDTDPKRFDIESYVLEVFEK